jgi:chemotaxis methyl-accepting protein methylase
LQVLKAADLYQLDRLKHLCERRIERYTDALNCTYLFQVADKFKAWELRAFCLEFIVRHANDLRTNSEFETLSPELLSEVTRALSR